MRPPSLIVSGWISEVPEVCAGTRNEVRTVDTSSPGCNERGT
ncbi:hypothetical protein ACQP2P_43400 [Dactylosporangium sp. CA-139114]